MDDDTEKEDDLSRKMAITLCMAMANRMDALCQIAKAANDREGTLTYSNLYMTLGFIPYVIETGKQLEFAARFSQLMREFVEEFTPELRGDAELTRAFSDADSTIQAEIAKAHDNSKS